MSNTVISVENVSKQYRLGVIGTGTFRNDLKLWWAKARNKPNPLALVDDMDHGNRENDILWALRDVSFKVEQGEALGIIGRNGAGKSTLLKILSRVTTPTSGEVKVKGRIASLLEVGTGFHPELTGRENIFLNGAIMGMSRVEVAKKFDEIVDFSGVEKFIDTPVKRYSSGMYVRLAFAVAAHLEPEILIVDEVLAVGDLRFQKKCVARMQDVADSGKTVLFVSHAMDSVRKLCTKCILLEKGEVIDIGETSPILTRYLRSADDDSTSSYWIRKPSDEWINKNEFIPNELLLETDDGEQISSIISSSKRLWVKIVGEIKTLQPNLVIGFSLFDSAGTLLFESSFNDMNENKWPDLKKGINSIRARIPVDLLNSGKYKVQLICALHQMYWIIAPGTGPVVTFDLITDHSESPYSGFQKRGLFVPTLDWENVE
jgi:lipopolysaccharide transport system ATP-binding protein